jgi:hypothetical protein
VELPSLREVRWIEVDEREVVGACLSVQPSSHRLCSFCLVSLSLFCVSASEIFDEKRERESAIEVSDR